MELLVVVAIIVVLGGVGVFYFLPQLNKSKEDVAKQQARDIAKACEMYATRNDGNLPTNLQALTVQSENGPAILPPDGIIDPWKKEFQYDPSGPNNGGNRPDVWTTSPSGKQIGNWGR
jgi:type II secretory pathway pseudopilin PulG